MKYKVMVGRKIDTKNLTLDEAISLKELLSQTYKKVHIEEQK